MSDTVTMLALDSIRHWRFDLAIDGDEQRPEISIWPNTDEEEGPPGVTLGVGPLLGQQRRFIDMTPDQARIIAHKLIETANAVDQIVSGS